MTEENKNLNKHALQPLNAPTRLSEDLAVWRGRPDKNTITLIQSLTHTDESGHRYYRRGTGQPWQRLRSAVDFAQLNRCIDARRPGLALMDQESGPTDQQAQGVIVQSQKKDIG